MDVSFWRAEDPTSTFTDLNFSVAVSEVFRHPPEGGLVRFLHSVASVAKKLNQIENGAWNKGMKGTGRLRCEARPETPPEEFIHNKVL